MPATVDTSQFNAMCKTLSGMSAVPYKQVVAFEVGRVMEKALTLTPAAKKGPIIAHWSDDQFSAQPDTLYTPKTPAGLRVRAKANRSKGGKLKYFLFNRYPDALYSQIVNRRLASLKRRIGAIGLAKQSWLRIAQQLGQTIKFPAWVEKAIPTTGIVHPENTSVQKTETTAKIQIDITNANPIVNLPTVGGLRALQAAIGGRIGFFNKNISFRVFNDVEKIAKKYPGMSVNSAAIKATA